MPIKFKPSEKRVDRNTKKVTIIHNYIKQMSKDSLFEYINSSNPNRKRRLDETKKQDMNRPCFFV